MHFALPSAAPQVARSLPNNALAADLTHRVPIDPWYRLAFNYGASATVGCPYHAAERPIR